MIPEGAKVGVLGRSGCGKSTLLKLMARVYQPRQGGSVRYFGQPLNDVMLDEVASFMQQQNVLFDDTVSTFKPPSEQSPQTFPCSHELPCFHDYSLTLLGCLRHPFICADANIALGLFEDNVRTRAARHANSLTERARGRACVCVCLCVCVVLSPPSPLLALSLAASIHESMQIERYLSKGKIDHDDALVKEACLTAQLWHDVPTLGAGRGLEAPAGYRGKFISGGLAQRVCLARCLIRRTPILFLDEPVSAQDDRMAQDLSEELGELKYPVRTRQGCVVEGAPERDVTVVAVTHNASLLKHFTHAAMMLHGRVVEFGTTEELLKRKGHYYRMIMSRTGLSVDARGNGRCTPERLRQVWLFASAPDVSLQELSKKFRTRVCVHGDVVYEKGSDADAMYFLVSGTIEAKEDSDESDGISTGRRFVYMAGEDFGVEGLLDKTFRWAMDAKVASRKATLLELQQDEFEEMLESDPLLRESAGRVLSDVNRLREPRSLGLLWPFYGAPIASLEALSMDMEPTVAFEGSALCQPPMDPCQDLVVVVAGSIELRRAPGPESPDGQTQLATNGASFGEFEMLPPPKPGSAEEIILSKQQPVVLAKATEFTVLLKLTRAKLEEHMGRDEGLAAAYHGNLHRWMHTVRPVSLRRHWLFCMCPPELLTLLSPIWRISAVPEGTALIDGDAGAFGGADSCVIVLDGSVEVQTQRTASGLKETTTVGADAIINAAALVGATDDGGVVAPNPFEFGEHVSRAEVYDESKDTFTTALVLTLSSAAFRLAMQTAANLQRDNGTEPPMDVVLTRRLRALATARAELLTVEGLRASGAMPDVFEDVHLRQLAREATTRALPSSDEALFQGNEKACVYIILAGELVAKVKGGEAHTLKARNVLASPMPRELGALPSTTIECVSAHATSDAGCVLLRYDLYALLSDLQSAHTAAQQQRHAEEAAKERQRRRDELRSQCNALQRELDQLELRLGLREGRSPQALWAWASKRVRLLLRLGQRGSLTAHPNAAAGEAHGRHRDRGEAAGSLEGRLKEMRLRKKELEQTARERHERLAKAVEGWDALQPAVLPEEAKLTFDRRPLLTLPHVAAVEGALEALLTIRRRERGRLLEQLEGGLEADQLDELLARAGKGVDHASLSALALASNELRTGDLAGPMANLQAQLRELWDELRIPKGPARQNYEWGAGLAIEDGQISACDGEVARLRRCAEVARSFMLEAESDRVLCGEVMGGMLLMMEEERSRHAAEEAARLADAREQGARVLEGRTRELGDAMQHVQTARSSELREEQKLRKLEREAHVSELARLSTEHAAELERLRKEAAEKVSQVATLQLRLTKAEETINLAEAVTGRDLDGDGDVGELGDTTAAAGPAAAGAGASACGSAAALSAGAAAGAVPWTTELRSAHEEIRRLKALVKRQGNAMDAAEEATGKDWDGDGDVAGRAVKELVQARAQPPAPPAPAPAGPQRQHTVPMMGKVDLDEGPDAPPVAQQLASALRQNATRIIDLFRAWDVDSSGTVTRKEFHSAMKKLGFNAPKLAINNLFDEWDIIDDGKIKLGELQKILLSADASLRPQKSSGVMGDATGGVLPSVTSSIEAVTVRELGPLGAAAAASAAETTPAAPAGPQRQHTVPMMGKVDLDEGPDAPPISQQLVSALRQNATRTIDLFRAWDVDGSGEVTRKEFHSGMKKLGFNAPKLAINNLFDEWDTDDGGKIKLGELQKVLLSASLQDKKESAAARAAKSKEWALDVQRRKAAAREKAAQQSAAEEDKQRAEVAQRMQSLASSISGEEGEIARDEDVEMVVELRDMEFSKVTDVFEMLAAGEGGMVGAFLEQYGRDVKPPGEATVQDLRQLFHETMELQGALTRLRKRCDKDGLIMQLRALMRSKKWDSTLLAKKLDTFKRQSTMQKITSAGDKKAAERKADGHVSLQGFRGFLAAHNLRFTEPSLDFLLQAAGTSLAECDASGGHIAVERVAHAVNSVPEDPLCTRRT